MRLAILLLFAAAALAQEQQEPKNAMGYFAVGNMHFEKRADDKALAAYDKAIALDAKNADFHVARCRTLARLQRHAEAIPACTEALRLKPNDPVALRWRGHFHISRREFKQAIADLTAAEKRKQDDSAIYYHLGLAQYLTGDFQAAARAFQRCLDLAKNDDDVIAAVAWLYPALERAGKQAEAKQALARIKPQMDVKENGTYHDRLLLFQGAKSEKEVAEGMNKDALARPTAGYGLGLWHLLNGRHTEAKRYFELASTSDYPTAFGHIAAEAELRNLSKYLKTNR